MSVLKPVHGIHPGFEAAVESHRTQDYPEFELIFDDYPNTWPNRKAGTLNHLIERARNPIIVINDADIVAPPGYLRAVVAPLADPRIGVVSCLYRAESDSFPGRFEALGVATDFAPSALVAPLFGVSEFGFGSTLAFRRQDLDAIGGFTALAGYLADDYQLGARIHRLGRKNLLSHVVVTTRLHADTWSAVWRHQLRWARTIRVSRFGGYIGLPVTFATLWALVAACFGHWWIALALLGIRLAMAVTAGWFVLRSSDVLKLGWLIPARDLFGAAVWAVGLFGNSVEWGGRILKLDRQGRIIEK